MCLKIAKQAPMKRGIVAKLYFTLPKLPQFYCLPEEGGPNRFFFLGKSVFTKLLSFYSFIVQKSQIHDTMQGFVVFN